MYGWELAGKYLRKGIDAYSLKTCSDIPKEVIYREALKLVLDQRVCLIVNDLAIYSLPIVDPTRSGYVWFTEKCVHVGNGNYQAYVKNMNSKEYIHNAEDLYRLLVATR